MKINIGLKKHNAALYVTAAIVLLFLVSLLFFVIQYRGKRREFIFPSVENNEYIVESRYLQKSSIDDSITVYVKELLLGPISERTKNLFSKNTRLLSCFEKDGVLYVNLSEDMLDLGDNVVSFKEGIKLFEKNIKQNFSGIKTVEIYVEGKGVYENY